jgi:hypothetical protein
MRNIVNNYPESNFEANIGHKSAESRLPNTNCVSQSHMSKV